MVSLEDLLIGGLIYSINNEKDTTQLIKWLYDGGNITPELGALIADILSGKVKAKPRQIKKTSPKRRDAIKAHIAYYQEILTEFKDSKQTIDLGDGFTLSWQEIDEQLKRSGYNGIPETKGEITRAAEHLVAHNKGLTTGQINEIIRRRKRKK